jgi:4-hydroxybenzoate adenylyltransferase
MEGNLASALAQRAQTHGWRSRPLFHTGAKTYTHGSVHDAAAVAAGALHAAGVRPGRRVLIVLPDSVGLVTAFLGTLRLGAVAVFGGPELPARTHTYIGDDAQPAAVVCPANLADRFSGVPMLDPGDLRNQRALIPDPVHVPPDTPAYVQYTSGTTGPPKGVVHSHGDPQAYFAALATGALGVTDGDVLFSVPKASYPYGLGNTVLFPMFSGGSSILWPDRPTPRGVVEQARRHRPTLLFGFPYFYRRLAGHLRRFPADQSVFARLRAAASASELLVPVLADRARRTLGCPVLDGLGSTEVGHNYISNTVTRNRPGSVGVVLDPYEIEVRTASGAPARTGERGVLHVRGPSVMAHYLGKPEQTAEVLGPDGWLDTGDLVHLDADGFVHHHGRLVDMETVAGTVVAPADVERVLGRHPAVGEVAVVRDLTTGRLRAFVVPIFEVGPSPELAVALLELAGRALPEPLAPHAVTFLAELPRSPGGKVRRAVLRRMD